MFKRIAAVYDQSPEAQRAFASAIQLAKTLNAELRIITVMARLPAYTAFAGVTDSSLPQMLNEDRLRFYETLQKQAQESALKHGVEIFAHMLEGPEVHSIVELLRDQQIDLLVIGLHQHDLYVARLWSKVYELAQEAPCSVLGVH